MQVIFVFVVYLVVIVCYENINSSTQVMGNEHLHSTPLNNGSGCLRKPFLAAQNVIVKNPNNTLDLKLNIKAAFLAECMRKLDSGFGQKSNIC